MACLAEVNNSDVRRSCYLLVCLLERISVMRALAMAAPRSWRFSCTSRDLIDSDLLDVSRSAFPMA